MYIFKIKAFEYFQVDILEMIDKLRELKKKRRPVLIITIKIYY
jgi:hypothetical protein